MLSGLPDVVLPGYCLTAKPLRGHVGSMPWNVVFAEEFEPEFYQLSESVQDAILVRAVLLEREGPLLGRPHADILQGSKHPNLKELRFSVDDRPWRIAFAFDPDRRAVLLAGGHKASITKRRFYKRLIARAEERFDRLLGRREG